MGRMKMKLGTKKTILGVVEILSGVIWMVTLVSLIMKAGSLSDVKIEALILCAFPPAYIIAGIGVLYLKPWALYLSLFFQLIAIIDIRIGEVFSLFWKPGIQLSVFVDLETFGAGVDLVALGLAYLCIRILKEQQ